MIASKTSGFLTVIPAKPSNYPLLRRMALRWSLSGWWKQEPGTSKLNCPSAVFFSTLPPANPRLQVFRAQRSKDSMPGRFQWASLAKSLSNFISSGVAINWLRSLNWNVSNTSSPVTVCVEETNSFRHHHTTALLDGDLFLTACRYLQHLLDVLLSLRFCDPVHIPLEHFDEISKIQGDVQKVELLSFSIKCQQIKCLCLSWGGFISQQFSHFSVKLP